MKAIKFHHSYFNTGKGLVIVWENYLVIMSKDATYPDTFHLYFSDFEAVTVPDKIREALDQMNLPEYSAVGTCQTSDMQTILEDMPDSVLAAIYTEVVGHNPFDDDTAENARKLITEYLMNPEAQTEIF